MKILREASKSKFEEMRERARNSSKNIASSYMSGNMGQMGPIKSFGEL
jgi:hypothetical protein